MIQAIIILGFRADVGAFIIDKYPSDFNADKIDAMNIYNLHRFRTTERNFQIIQSGGENIASYYSGFKNTNYIGEADHCVSLVLEKGDNPLIYEKVLIKVTNNLLSIIGSDDFEYAIADIYGELSAQNFDDIKVLKGTTIDLDEAPVEKKAIATVTSSIISDEEKIFADLMGSEELDTSTQDFDNKLSDFTQAGSSADPFAGDPFSGAGAKDPFAADPFAASAGTNSNAFAENPFADTQKPSLGKAFGVDDTLGKQMFQKKRTSAAEIVKKLDQMDGKKPQKPSSTDKDAQFKYLQSLVGFLEEKVKILGTLANQVKDLEKSHGEKDALIGKLLLLIKG